MKILVTGAAGAIGSHLCEKLVEKNHKVIGIDALTPYYSTVIKKINIKDIEEKGTKVYIKNLIKDDFSDFVRDVDVIFHFAAQPGISSLTSFDDFLNNNILATYKLLEESIKNPNLKAFFFISTSSVYGKEVKGDESSEPKPTSNYGVTKLASEQLALSYFRDKNLPVVSLRLFSVYGERERPEKLFHKLIKAILEDQEFPLYEGSGEHVRSYTYVGDIIDGCLLAMKNLDKCVGQIFNLGNNKTNTTGEGIRMLEEILNKKAKFRIIPKRAGDQIETVANIEKAKNYFGYSPKVNLRTGLENEVKWYKDKIHGKI